MSAASNGLSSPSGQKRSRDYADELKGLTPERDSDQDVASSLSRKKQRTGAHDDSGHSDGVDDGETAELDVAPQTSEAKAARVPEDAPQDSAPEKPPSEDSAPVGSAGWNRGVALGVRTSFGKASKARPSSTTPARQGLSNEVPKLASSTPLPEKPQKQSSGDELSEGEVTEEYDSNDEDGDEDSSTPSGASGTPSEPQGAPLVPAGKPGDVLNFRAAKRAWTLPLDRIVKLRWDEEMVSSSFWSAWLDRELDYIIAVMMDANPGQSDRITRSALSTMLGKYLHPKFKIASHMACSGRKKKTAKAEAVKAMNALPQTALDRALSGAKLRVQDRDFTIHGESWANGDAESSQTRTPVVPGRASTSAANGDGDGSDGLGSGQAMAPASGADVLDESDDEETRHLELYFPRSADAPVTCLHCASIRHRSKQCPMLACPACGSSGHSLYGCPTKQRCLKCYQIGHTRDDCQEKLTLARSERPGCAYCSAAHGEDECTDIWRSFASTAEDRKKVQAIPYHCFMCGAAGHYGSECGLPGAPQPGTLGWTTWSKANHDLYVDTDCGHVAIAQAAADAHTSSDFHIKGRATKTTHIHFVSSDDSDEEFLHPPVSRGQPRGDIRIATNIATPSQPRRGRNAQQRPDGVSAPQGHGNQSFQPPLPPGPPPGDTRGRFAPSVDSLPPRPHVFSNGGASSGASPGARGDSGGRGRGRGRPRGRGRGGGNRGKN